MAVAYGVRAVVKLSSITVSSLYLSLAAVLAASAAAQSIRPSFDCRRATFPDEREICRDDRLAQMDQAASIALGQIKASDLKSARESAFAMLTDRHACGASRMCILDNQAQVIEMLGGFGAKVGVPPWVGAYRLELIESGAVPMVSGLPKRVGACTRTKIASIGTRFGATLKPPSGDGTDEGTTVEYANQGHQVSYSYDAAVGDSAIGDEVALCLVSLPKDCPPGDDRGKVYSATNLRTKGSWIMPDAQHICGGA